MGEDREVLATGVGNTVVSPVGVPPAGGGGGGVVPAAVVVVAVVLVLVEVVLVVVDFVLVVADLVVVAVVAADPWRHCEYHSLAAVQTHPLGQAFAPVHPVPPPVDVSCVRKKERESRSITHIGRMGRPCSGH